MGEPVYIRQTETESTMGDRIFLYYFTKEGICNGNVRYGVGIDMYTQFPDRRTLKERKLVENLFESEKDAEKFVDVLCSGIVTPATLDDIVEDNVIA